MASASTSAAAPGRPTSTSACPFPNGLASRPSASWAKTSAFLGGIGQGVQRVTLRPIRSRGGWISAWYDWTSDWHSAVGFTIDDPWNRDLPTRGDRIHNHAIFANATYDVTDKLLVGFEVSYFKTLYRDMLPGEAVRCEFLVKYGF